MEFILEKEVSEIVPAAVVFNFDQLKQELEVSLGKYQNMVVTEDSTKEAKVDRAKLNALKTTIDDKRKEIKREWNAPYIEFENKIKILTGMIDEPIQTIDKQVKAYEQAVKAKKQEEIYLFFHENIGDLKGLVSYEKIHVNSWLNAGSKMNAIQAEITAIIETINSDIAVIKGLELECEQQMLDKYLVNFSLSEAMAEKKRWEDQLLKIAEFEKKKQEKAKELEALKSAAVEAEVDEIPGQVNVMEAATWQPERREPAPDHTQQLEVLDFRVFVTAEQKALLREFLISNKIKYGKVK